MTDAEDGSAVDMKKEVGSGTAFTSDYEGAVTGAVADKDSEATRVALMVRINAGTPPGQIKVKITIELRAETPY